MTHSNELHVQLELMGARELEITSFSDNRGHLGVLADLDNLPFETKRLFFLKNVPAGQFRGKHAHKKCRQIVVPLSGDCFLTAERNGVSVSLQSANLSSALLFPAFTWVELSNFTDDCVLLVLADMEYDESDYITNYEDFVSKGSHD